VRAQIFRQLFFVASTADCDGTESHVPRKLHTKMPKAANALHSDEISGAQAGIAKRVVGRNACAKERSGFRGCELIRNRRDGACFSDHHFGISPICGYSRHDRVLTIDNVSAPARFTHAVFSGNETDADPLTDFPSGYSAAQGINAANDFMSRNARQSQARVDALTVAASV